MKRIHFVMIMHAVILAVSALPVVYAVHKQHEQTTHESSVCTSDGKHLNELPEGSPIVEMHADWCN